MRGFVRPAVHTLRVAIAATLCMASVQVFAQAAPQASSPEMQEVSRLVRSGQYQAAIDKAKGVLATKPKDALARFLTGVSLTELGKTNDAIAVFQSITEDNPELPEPYNNLAVLYASKGQFEKARTALELAIQTHPSYSTAHENLGDVYAKLASQAYDRALQLDKGNSAVQGKLSLIKDLFSTQPKPSQKPDAAKVAAATAPAPNASAPAAVTKLEVPKLPESTVPARVATTPTPTPAANPPAASTPAAVAPAVTSAAAAPVRSLPAVAPANTAATAPVAPKAAAGEADAVIAVVRGWAESWSNQDVDAYIANYSSQFKPDDGKSRRDWERERRERITAPSYVKVGISDPTVVMNSDNTAEVTFRQNYDSSRLKSHTVRKTLVMVKTKSGWQITRERNS